MYAIIEIAGKQFRVEEKRRLRVPLLNVESGKKVEFDNVLVYNDDKKLQIGTPNVDKVKVSATVVEHNREKKIIVFKKKRRKGYQVKNGHRQDYSLILVDKIGAGSVTKTKPVEEEKVKKETKPATKAAPKTATAVKPKKTTTVKKETKPKAETKSTAKKETKTVAKPAAKKATTKKAVTTKKATPKDKKE